MHIQPHEDPPVLRGGLPATVPNGDVPSVPPRTLRRSSSDTKEPSLLGERNRKIRAVPPMTPKMLTTGAVRRLLRLLLDVFEHDRGI